MPQGSCVCGDFRYEYSGEPAANVICHCLPCRKTAGLRGSTNFIVPDDKYKVLSGTERTYTRKGISGKNVEYHMCSTCGVIMFVTADAIPNAHIVKCGTLDDLEVLNAAKPAAEIFTKDRLEWCPILEGTSQKEIQ